MDKKTEKEWEKKIEEKFRNWGSKKGDGKDFKDWCKGSSNTKTTTGSIVYCLGVVGAIVYYIQNATGFWDGVYGVLQSLVWPAILVYKALQNFGL